jgi:hypothetical protein
MGGSDLDACQLMASVRAGRDDAAEEAEAGIELPVRDAVIPYDPPTCALTRVNADFFRCVLCARARACVFLCGKNGANTVSFDRVHYGTRRALRQSGFFIFTYSHAAGLVQGAVAAGRL